MNRRALMAGLFVLAAPVPAAARVYRIGFISSSTARGSRLVRALMEGLRAREYQEGKNLEILYRFAHSRDQLPAMAVDLVERKVDLIVAAGSEGIVAARAATQTIPIVM